MSRPADDAMPRYALREVLAAMLDAARRATAQGLPPPWVAMEAAAARDRKQAELAAHAVIERRRR